MNGIEQILADMKRAFESKKRDFPAEEKKVRYPCFRCGGTGIIFTVDDGVTKAMRCPDCLHDRQVASWLRKSGISLDDYKKYTLDSFLADTKESTAMKQIAMRFLKDPKANGIGYFGRSGSGKTHICIAICQALGKEHHYWQYRQKIQNIKAVMYTDEKRYNELMDEARYSPYLYIDDLFKGAVVNNQANMQDVQIVFDIINARYIKHLPTIVSSEYLMSEIVRFDEAIGGRLFEMLSPYIYNTAENRRLHSMTKASIIKSM